ncbi:MAG: galactose mutarotase [Clostridiales bacterium]|nr:galactose mutarotase [Clostridiales bacterium]
MNIQKEAFGVTKSDKPVTKYILSNDNGMEVHILDYGAIITSIIVPDKDGNLDDIALGYDSIAEYEDNGPSYGAFIGRNSNRIQNASFELNGTVYNLDKNDGNNNLHGGYTGYHKMMYEATTLQDDTSVSIELSRLSPHMEQGFPGNLEVKVIYSLTNDNQLIIKYHAVSDQDTVVNLTNHSYFNLSGHNAGSVLDHKVWIKSDSFTPTDDNLIPTGEIADVTNTPMDFRQLKTLGKDINADYPPLKIAGGYDHNYVLNKETSGIERIAQLIDDKSGRVMDVYTDLPGMQLYSGNFMPTEKGKVGATYQKRYGVCFETQYYPNNINQPSFPSSVLRAGEEFNSTTIYKFS